MTDTRTGVHFRRVVTGAFSKWNILGTLTLLSGIAIGLGVPLWPRALAKNAGGYG
jgi:hypothetical protein